MCFKLYYIGDMVAYGFLADKQLARNVARRFILHEEFENFPFTMCQQKFAVTIAALQNASPLLARVLWFNKVKGYSQHIL